MLPIIAQEDPYMIWILGQQIYIKIVKTITMGWVEGVNLFFFLLSMNLLVNMVSKKKNLGFKITLGMKLL